MPRILLMSSLLIAMSMGLPLVVSAGEHESKQRSVLLATGNQGYTDSIDRKWAIDLHHTIITYTHSCISSNTRITVTQRTNRSSSVVNYSGYSEKCGGDYQEDLEDPHETFMQCQEQWSREHNHSCSIL